VPTIRLMWVDSEGALQGYEGDVDQSVMDAGEFEPNAASNFPGPSGTFHAVPREYWAAMNMEDPAPTFLHESYSAHVQKWIEFVPHPAQEAAIVGKVRDAVMELVDSRIAANPKTLTVSPTVTATKEVNGTRAIVGRAIVIQPVS
jgi:hypothetical protein